MPKDFIIKAGSSDDDFYFILDGNVLMYGLDEHLIGILSSGAHFSNDCEDNYKNR
jgi:CRP-like cAMP-binding protein